MVGGLSEELQTSSAEGLRTLFVYLARINRACRWLTGSWPATENRASGCYWRHLWMRSTVGWEVGRRSSRAEGAFENVGSVESRE